MDPTTTLVTFMFQTPRSSPSLSLVGSWDNFTKRYPMERDVRRSRGQWRGCYCFKDIICDGNERCKTRRNGGLKMGMTYFYYYELDDGTEVYDLTIPSTTCCPYLPGQPVNLLFVPVEIRRPRSRSASMTCMVEYDVKTMDPKNKFQKPRAPTSLPASNRLNSSPTTLALEGTQRPCLSTKAKTRWSPRALFNSGLQSALPRRRSFCQRFSMPVSPSGRGSSSNQLRLARRASSLNTHSDSALLSCSVARLSASEDATKFDGASDAAHGLPKTDIQRALNKDSLDRHRSSAFGQSLTSKVSTPASTHSCMSVPSSTNCATTKPLPELPVHRLSPLLSASLWAQTGVEDFGMSDSLGSGSTIFTALPSPASSQFCFSEVPSDNEGIVGDLGSPAESLPGREARRLSFDGYSLPEPTYDLSKALKRDATLPQSTPDLAKDRRIQDDPLAIVETSGVQPLSELQALIDDMSYLGDVIVGQ